MITRALWIFLCVTMVLVSAVVWAARQPAQNSTEADNREAKEEDIREVVIRYQMEEWIRDGDKNEREARDPREKAIAKQLNSRIFFISVNGKDPTDEFLKRFQNIPRAIKKQSRVHKGLHRWVTDKDTNKNGIVFRANEIRWRDGTEVAVEGGYWCGSLCAAGDIFVARFDGRKWKVAEVQTKWIS